MINDEFDAVRQLQLHIVKYILTLALSPSSVPRAKTFLITRKEFPSLLVKRISSTLTEMLTAKRPSLFGISSGQAVAGSTGIERSFIATFSKSLTFLINVVGRPKIKRILATTTMV